MPFGRKKQSEEIKDIQQSDPDLDSTSTSGDDW